MASVKPPRIRPRKRSTAPRQAPVTTPPHAKSSDHQSPNSEDAGGFPIAQARDKFLGLSAIEAASFLGGLQLLLIIMQIVIAAQQNYIVRELGNAQNETAKLQAFLSSVQVAGIEPDSQRRMATASLTLFDELVKIDKRNESFRAALPTFTESQIAIALRNASTEEQKANILAVASRLKAKSSEIQPTGKFFIVLTSVKREPNAERAYRNAITIAEGSPRPLRARLYVNQDDYLVVALASFESQQEALNAIPNLRLDAFPAPLVEQSAGWKELCSGDADTCAAAIEARKARSLQPNPPAR